MRQKRKTRGGGCAIKDGGIGGGPAEKKRGNLRERKRRGAQRVPWFSRDFARFGRIIGGSPVKFGRKIGEYCFQRSLKCDQFEQISTLTPHFSNKSHTLHTFLACAKPSIPDKRPGRRQGAVSRNCNDSSYGPTFSCLFLSPQNSVLQKVMAQTLRMFVLPCMMQCACSSKKWL